MRNGGSPGGRDLVAYAPRSKIPRPGNVYSTNGCNTSNAAPAAAGAAIDFADHYFMTYGSLIFDPGILKVAMLLMGDRYAENGTLSTGFDNLYGAGRMRMRRLDGTGMDNPWGYGLGTVCIDDGQWYHMDLNDGNSRDADVNVVKAAIWWYDRRLEDGTPIDDIDLRLKRNGTNVAYSESNDDEKERIRYDTGGTAATYTLTFHGTDVTADDAGCGTNSMLVYYAYLYEDSDRDDPTGPVEILPE